MMPRTRAQKNIVGVGTPPLNPVHKPVGERLNPSNAGEAAWMYCCTDVLARFCNTSTFKTFKEQITKCVEGAQALVVMWDNVIKQCSISHDCRHRNGIGPTCETAGICGDDDANIAVCFRKSSIIMGSNRPTMHVKPEKKAALLLVDTTHTNHEDIKKLLKKSGMSLFADPTTTLFGGKETLPSPLPSPVKPAG